MSDSSDSPLPEGGENFVPVPVRARFDGWTADRQRRFIRALSEIGCVSQAAAEVGMTARSAYRLAARPDAQSFARAWNWALVIASPRLTSLAHEYVVHGMRETVWKEGVCIYERRRPSEKLLMFLLTHLAPNTFGKAAYMAGFRDLREVGVAAMPRLLDDLRDVSPDECEAEEARPNAIDWDDDESAPPA